MAKWFRRRGAKKNEQTMVLQGIEGVASRAIYQGYKQYPTIQMTFKVRHGSDEVRGEEFDTVEIELDLWEAEKFGTRFLAALDAAMPKMPKAASRSAFMGEG